nr:Peptidase, M50 family protein [uncultured bacterium]
MLAPLREELSLHPGPAGADGQPTWTIRDPVRGRYFRIGWPAFEILSRWGLGNPVAIAASVRDETTLDPMPEDVKDVAAFLADNQLLQPTGHADVAMLARRANTERQGWFYWLLHHYLFFRIPMVRPDRFLEATVPLVQWVGRPWFLFLSMFAALLGLFLILRQWDVFAATLVDTFTFEGMLGYGVALAFVKTVHELAHAYTAKRFGCRVPTMGVAFLVMWPVLYTDVNETWMLASRRQRLLVGGAGILSELAIAAWATLAWTFLPEGALRQAAFVLATLTWISSLAINLSPFMRFDGYFLMMDALEAPNLHPRSFAMGRWWLRELLFGLGEPPPEPMAAGRRLTMVLFAFSVWLYRLMLFLGIAVLVYHFFIKAVGVLLFCVEIGWFVILPIWHELAGWFAIRDRIRSGHRSKWTLAAATFLLLAGLVPWQSRIQAPAALKGERTSEMFLPFPARLDEARVERGSKVEAGHVLFVFSSPEFGLRQVQIEARLAGKLAELEAAQLQDPTYREQGNVIREAISKAEAELAALRAESARLTLVAPHEGMVFDLLPGLEPGQWLSPRQKLAVVRSSDAAVADAYVREDDLDRVKEGTRAVFYPDSLDLDSFMGRVVAIDRSPVKSLTDGSLASIHGGSLPARVSGKMVVPEGAVYRLRINLDAPAPKLLLRGSVVLEGEARSLLGRLARAVSMVVVREWGM